MRVEPIRISAQTARQALEAAVVVAGVEQELAVQLDAVGVRRHDNAVFDVVDQRARPRVLRTRAAAAIPAAFWLAASCAVAEFCGPGFRDDVAVFGLGQGAAFGDLVDVYLGSWGDG